MTFARTVLVQPASALWKVMEKAPIRVEIFGFQKVLRWHRPPALLPMLLRDQWWICSLLLAWSLAELKTANRDPALSITQTTTQRFFLILTDTKSKRFAMRSNSASGHPRLSVATIFHFRMVP